MAFKIKDLQELIEGSIEKALENRFPKEKETEKENEKENEKEVNYKEQYDKLKLEFDNLTKKLVGSNNPTKPIEDEELSFFEIEEEYEKLKGEK